MAGLLNSLNNTAQTLNTNARQLQLTGHNIANAENPNFARQSVQTGYLTAGNTGNRILSTGIQTQSVQHARDALLDGRIVNENATLASLQTQSEQLRSLTDGLSEFFDFGSTGAVLSNGESSASTASLSVALNQFFNAWESYSANPNDPAAAQNVFANGSRLATSLNNAGSNLEQTEGSIDSAIADHVDRANTHLQTIADLNRDITRAEANNAARLPDLVDQRQKALEALAESTAFSTSGSGGQLTLSVQDASGESVTLVQGNAVRATLQSENGTVSADPGGELVIEGGGIQGLQVVRAGTLADMRSAMDSLADQLVSSVNSIYNPGGADGDFFDADGTTATGFGLDATLGAATVRADLPGNPGGNRIALELANLALEPFARANGDAIDGTPGGHLASVTAAAAIDLETADRQLETQQLFTDSLNAQRSNVSGVSMDEELSNLLRFQRSFEASAKVFSTIDRLLNLVVNDLAR